MIYSTATDKGYKAALLSTLKRTRELLAQGKLSGSAQ